MVHYNLENAGVISLENVENHFMESLKIVLMERGIKSI